MFRIAMPMAGVGYQTALASQQWGLPMNLKLLTAVAIFATAPIVTFAQNGDPADQAPKPTLADAENVVQTISSDKTKLQAFCKLGKLPDQMQKAEDRNDTKGVDALVAKADPLAQQIGPMSIQALRKGRASLPYSIAFEKSANSNESDQ